MSWTDLIYSLDGCPVTSQHPQVEMKSIGITYRHAVPQSMYASWWFFGCVNVPEVLPDWIRAVDLAPYEKLIGNGLSPADAERLTQQRADDSAEVRSDDE